MTAEEFRARLKTSDIAATELVAHMRSVGADESELYPLIKSYLCLKFMIDESEAHSDELVELAKQSIEQIAGLKKGGLKFVDHSGSCSSVSSAITKKVLLLISLQKALGITFPKEEVAYILTVTQLTHSVAKRLEENEL